MPRFRLIHDFSSIFNAKSETKSPVATPRPSPHFQSEPPEFLRHLGGLSFQKSADCRSDHFFVPDFDRMLQNPESNGWCCVFCDNARLDLSNFMIKNVWITNLTIFGNTNLLDAPGTPVFRSESEWKYAGSRQENSKFYDISRVSLFRSKIHQKSYNIHHFREIVFWVC